MTTKSHPNRIIIVISSPSGAGKSSICERLLKEDRNLKISVSDTTRSPRDNEIDGTDYNFISAMAFKERIKKKEYIEHAKVFNNYYGSRLKNIEILLSDGYDVLFDIDWQGSLQLKKTNLCSVLTIFIVPPSKKVIYERLIQRASKSGDDKEAINNRMKMYETEMSHHNEYDHIVLNDIFDDCVEQIKKIIKDYRSNIK